MAGLPTALQSQAAKAQAPANGAVVAVAPATKPPGFTWTAEDVKAAVDDLIAGAITLEDVRERREKATGLPPPSPVSSSGLRDCFAVVGPKGGKTVASLAIKTTKCCGLPRPAGSISVVLHVDNQAAGSFDDFLWKMKADVDGSERLFFIGIGERRGRYLGRPKRSESAQSAYVRDVVLALLSRLKERQDVGLLVFDGYGDFCNQFGSYVAAHESKVDSPLHLEGTKWGPRREMFEDLMSAGFNAVVPGGFFIVNGPDGGFDSEDTADKKAKLAKRLRREGLEGREPIAKWFNAYRENNANVSCVFETELGKTPQGEPVYTATVWEGRRSRLGITTGRTLDITGRSIGAFADPALLPSSDKPGANA